MAEHDDNNSVSTATGTKAPQQKNKVRNFAASVVLVLYCVYCGRGVSYYIHCIPTGLLATHTHTGTRAVLCGGDSRLGYGFTWIYC